LAQEHGDCFTGQPNASAQALGNGQRGSARSNHDVPRGGFFMKRSGLKMFLPIAALVVTSVAGCSKKNVDNGDTTTPTSAGAVTPAPGAYDSTAGATGGTAGTTGGTAVTPGVTPAPGTTGTTTDTTKAKKPPV
jgi:hypothetical protein